MPAIDQVDKLTNNEYDGIIAVFAQGVSWQFKGWKWNGVPADRNSVQSRLVSPALQLRMDLKEREERIRQLSAALENSGTGIGMDPRVGELEDTIMKLQDFLATKETQAMMNNTDHQGRYALEGALRRIDEKQARIVELEEELMRQRMMRTNRPQDFTDKNLSGHEMTTMRMEMERSEVELAERKSELMNCQNRMQTAEETSN